MIRPDRAARGMWWDRAWSLVEGCTPVSRGCDRCWARAMDRRFRDGDREVRFREDRLRLPGTVRRSTVWSIWTDLMHEAVTDAQIDAAKERIDCSPYHSFLVLSKRPERLHRVGVDYRGNTMIGTSVEDQESADDRLPLLASSGRAEALFVSAEPLLGPVDLRGAHVGWVIVGSETGARARPCADEWIESLSRQCEASGTPYWYKHGGSDKLSARARRREVPAIIARTGEVYP